MKLKALHFVFQHRKRMVKNSLLNCTSSRKNTEKCCEGEWDTSVCLNGIKLPSKYILWCYTRVSVWSCCPEGRETLPSQTGKWQEKLILRRKLVPSCPCPTWEPHTLSVKSWSIFLYWKSIAISNTFIFLWLQVLWLPWLLPVQVALHNYGDVVVLLLQSDGVHNRCKADIAQTHACFLQHLSVCTFLPCLPFKAKNVSHVSDQIQTAQL